MCKEEIHAEPSIIPVLRGQVWEAEEDKAAKVATRHSTREERAAQRDDSRAMQRDPFKS